MKNGDPLDRQKDKGNPYQKFKKKAVALSALAGNQRKSSDFRRGKPKKMKISLCKKARFKKGLGFCFV